MSNKTSCQYRRMIKEFNIDPCGRRCGDCDNIIKVCVGMRNVYKCKVNGISGSAASDWRLKWDACGRFKEEEIDA